jgi:hypothetical protein
MIFYSIFLFINNNVQPCALFGIVKKRDARFCDACVAGSTVKYSNPPFLSGSPCILYIYRRHTWKISPAEYFLEAGLVFCCLYIQAVFMLQAMEKLRKEAKAEADVKHLNGKNT